MRGIGIGVLVLLLGGCGPGTPVTFRNASDHPLEGVVLSGSGFEATLGRVAPGESVSATVHPEGESGLAVRFRVNGRDVAYAPQDYLESTSYRVSATVNRDLSVDVTSAIGP